MTTLWKLTTSDWKTRKGFSNETTWGPGVTVTASGKGDLCGPGWVHAYTSPELAVLLNPIHADIPDPVLWRAEGEIGKSDHGLKVGTTSLTTIEIVPLPAVTTEQRVKFAILCAKAVCDDAVFVSWADKWLSGEDRSEKAAEAAARSAWAAAAARSARSASAAAATRSAWAASAAAEATASAAAEATAAAPLDLAAIAKEALS